MYIVTSTTLTDEEKFSVVPLLEWKYQIPNGRDAEMTVSDPLLDNETVAEERARSEILKNAYKMREVTFETWRTDFTKNEVIIVRGLPYIVKGITVSIQKVITKTQIRAIRYEL